MIPPQVDPKDLLGQEARNIQILYSHLGVSVFIKNPIDQPGDFSRNIDGRIVGETEASVAKAKAYIEWMIRFAQRGVEGTTSTEERIYRTLNYGISLGGGALPNIDHLELSTVGILYEC